MLIRLTLFLALTFAAALGRAEGRLSDVGTETRSRVSIVVLANFTCPYSRAMDEQYDMLKANADRLGIRMVNGFIPHIEGNKLPSWARERAYYALRDAGLEKQARRLIFRAVHDMKMPLETDDSVLAWFASVGEPNVDLEELRVWMRPGGPAEWSVLKSIQHLEWIKETPSIVFVKDAQPLYVLSPKTVGGSIPELVKEAIRVMETLAPQQPR